MSYTINELGNIQLMAKQIADTAALAQAISIFGQEEHKEKHLDYYAGELQKHFATLHSAIIGDMEAAEAPPSDSKAKDSLAAEVVSGGRLVVDYERYGELVSELGVLGAEDELYQVMKLGQVFSKLGARNLWSFNWHTSPQGFKFWQRILG